MLLHFKGEGGPHISKERGKAEHSSCDFSKKFIAFFAAEFDEWIDSGGAMAGASFDLLSWLDMQCFCDVRGAPLVREPGTLLGKSASQAQP